MAESSQGTTSNDGNSIPYTHRPVFPQSRGRGRRPRGNYNGSNQNQAQGEGSQLQEQQSRRQRRNTNRNNQETDLGQERNQPTAGHSRANFEGERNEPSSRGRGKSSYRGHQFSRGQGNQGSYSNKPGTSFSVTHH